jgi:hypothetical protein
VRDATKFEISDEVLLKMKKGENQQQGRISARKEEGN